MIDFTIKRVSANGNTVSLEYTVFLGDVTTADEFDPFTETTQSVTRYRRQSVLKRDSVTFNKAEAIEMLNTLGETAAATLLESITIEEGAAQLLPAVEKYLQYHLQEMAAANNTTVYVAT